MFKRLFVLVLLAIATVSVSTPAHAATLAVSLTCYHSMNDPSGTFRYFDCYASASGGSPNYTFQWYHNMYGNWGLVKQETTGGFSQIGQLRCWGHSGFPPTYGAARVVVTDSAGAQVTAQSTVYCPGYVE